MANFDLAYMKTSGNEGGYANVSGDTGGETYAGVSRRWFPKWDGWAIVDSKKPLRHGQLIHDQQLEQLVKAFYKMTFWDAVGGDLVDDQPTAERLYDFGVNAGQPKSVKQIQAILGIPQTGKVDPITVAAINKPAKYLSA